MDPKIYKYLELSSDQRDVIIRRKGWFQLHFHKFYMDWRSGQIHAIVKKLEDFRKYVKREEKQIHKRAEKIQDKTNNYLENFFNNDR